MFSGESTVEIFWPTRLKLLHRVQLKTEMSRETLVKSKISRLSLSLCLQGKVFVWQTETPKVSRDAWKARFRCANCHHGQLLNVIYNLTVKQYHVVMKIYVPTTRTLKMLKMNYRCEEIFVTEYKRIIFAIFEKNSEHFRFISYITL